mmetsp:Transcript_71038/g.201316  ORF Transcript_71038/g.201316 Transcript_71038/m.201316 type:complete len:293 (+) Transcript_71038:55-933(+)
MVLVDSAYHCFSGFFSGILQPSKAAAVKAAYALPLVQPAKLLPESGALPAELARELQKASGSNPGRCAVAGVAGPVLAALLGGADGLGVSDRVRMAICLAARRELLHLDRLLGNVAAEEVKMLWASVDDATSASRDDAFDLLLMWCAAAVVPTYEAGMHVALGVVDLGDGDEPSRSLAGSAAKNLQMLFSRARIDAQKEAPMLAKTCQALCGAADPAAAIEEAIALGRTSNRSPSPPQAAKDQQDRELPPPTSPNGRRNSTTAAPQEAKPEGKTIHGRPVRAAGGGSRRRTV